MSKQLYEEAIADVKKLKEIAEDNAKRAVIEAVAPRIRELIEKELLEESSADMSAEDDHDDKNHDKILTDDPTKKGPEAKNNEMSMSIGELTSEEDEKKVEEDQTASEVTLEDVMEIIASKSKNETLREFEEKLRYVEKMIDSLSSIEQSMKESKSFENKVSSLEETISELYEHANTRIVSSTQKLSCNLKIQNCLKKLEKLQEIKMKKRNGRLDEETISIELTGVPDDVDLESLGVNLVSGGGEEEDEEAGEDMEDLGGEEEGGDDMEDLGGDDEEGAEDEEDMEEMSMPNMPTTESRRLNDNLIVEIDEGMLRREIARMKAIREEAVPSTKGEAPGSDEFDDFGDAEEEGEPLEMTLSEVDEASMTDETYEAYGVEGEAAKRTDSLTKPSGAEQPNVQSDSPVNEADEDEEGAENPADEAAKCESIRRQMVAELKLQESLRARARGAARLYEASKAKFNKTRTLSERKEIARHGDAHKAAYTGFAKRYNESVKRFNKLSEALAEAKRPSNVRSNSNVKPGASAGDVQLRNKLAETNLLNAKLMFTNKLLQSEALTSRQKSQVIAQLDEAATLREVKLVYESLAKTLAAPRKPVTEGRVLGSSSQATRSASAQPLNEGYEAERWAKLAGIAK
jgi:hypothetical protein